MSEQLKEESNLRITEEEYGFVLHGEVPSMDEDSNLSPREMQKFRADCVGGLMNSRLADRPATIEAIVHLITQFVINGKPRSGEGSPYKID